MMKQNIQDAFNRQVNAELFSSYLYLSMAAYLESQSVSGMATWMRIQAQEEHAHAMKFFDFVLDRDGRIILTRIEAPKTEWNSPLNVFEEALEHEQKVTGMIYDLVDLSFNEKDHAANTFLQWFVTEQVEEEATAKSIVDKLKFVSENPGALFMLDRELGQRALPSPTTTTE